jgi:hypothetical protein
MIDKYKLTAGPWTALVCHKTIDRYKLTAGPWTTLVEHLHVDCLENLDDLLPQLLVALVDVAICRSGINFYILMGHSLENRAI